MKIDEMIKQIKQRDKCENEKPEICLEHDCENCENNYDESFFEHEAWKQIISWLEELKDYRDKNKIVCKVDVLNMDELLVKVNEAYNDGRADAIDDVTNKYFDAIEYVLHQKDIKLELNQALTIYARIMNKCNMIAEQLKDKTE